MHKIGKAIIGTMLSTQLLAPTPVAAQGLQEEKQDLVELFSKTSLMDKELKQLLSFNKNTIFYFTLRPTPVYSHPDMKQEFCIIPEGTYLRAEQIDETQSTKDMVCCIVKGKKVWIHKDNLSTISDNLINQYLKPKTEKSIVVDKTNRKMFVYDQYGNNLLKEFTIALSPMEEGDKTIEGDGNAPEGKYYICHKNPKSSFGINPKTGGHLGSLQISYPNTQDAVEGLISGDISKSEYQGIKNSIQEKKIPSQGTALGNSIMIHGGGNEYDRTLGCMGLNDEDMLWLNENIGTGTDIFIR